MKFTDEKYAMSLKAANQAELTCEFLFPHFHLQEKIIRRIPRPKKQTFQAWFSTHAQPCFNLK